MSVALVAIGVVLLLLFLAWLDVQRIKRGARKGPLYREWRR
jgi:hypothetical protein